MQNIVGTLQWLHEVERDKKSLWIETIQISLICDRRPSGCNLRMGVSVTRGVCQGVGLVGCESRQINKKESPGRQCRNSSQCNYGLLQRVLRRSCASARPSSGGCASSLACQRQCSTLPGIFDKTDHYSQEVEKTMDRDRTRSVNREV